MKRYLAFLFFATSAFAETPCPSEDLRFCFQCLGTSSIYSCCANPASATGYTCAVANCPDPVQVDCTAQVNPLKEQVSTLTAEKDQWKAKAQHPNGQLYSEHWNACALNNFQLWRALHNK